ncbi:MAG: hypothetical protein JO023_00465 [Chloroflexi bacterium]|nr:hypothetical protein [Chloroflexota bacterium]
MTVRTQSAWRPVLLDGADGPEAGRQAEAGGLARHESRQPCSQEVLATVAHDLRLPLSHIKGFVTTLRRDDLEWDEASRKDFLAEIELEADRLAQMIDALLQAPTATDGGRPAGNLASTDAGAVVKGALHRTRGLFGTRPLRVDIASGLPQLRLDASEMERVLANLIQNAIKYSPAGTPITVSARLTGADEVELAVEDEGSGVPVEDRARIFDRFFRTASSRQSAVPGHGLGLAICQSIVLAHGGHIEVGDRRGGGARFSVLLPVPINRRSQARRDDQYAAVRARHDKPLRAVA